MTDNFSSTAPSTSPSTTSLLSSLPTPNLFYRPVWAQQHLIESDLTRPLQNQVWTIIVVCLLLTSGFYILTER